MLKTWGAQTIYFASWDFPAMASSAFYVLCIKCNQLHGTVWWSECIGSLKCIKCHLLHRSVSVPGQTHNNCRCPLLLLPFSLYCWAGNGIHVLTRWSSWVRPMPQACSIGPALRWAVGQSVEDILRLQSQRLFSLPKHGSSGVWDIQTCPHWLFFSCKLYFVQEFFL